MASSTLHLHHLLLLSIVLVLGFFSIPSAIARPCKTFFISSYSISRIPNSYLQNPNFFQDKPNPSENSITIFAEFTQFNPKLASSSSSGPGSEIFIHRPNFIDLEPQFNHHHHTHQLHHHQEVEEEDAHFVSFDSLRDRTKDVLSVVVALLFGVGCGALTAGTMYLAWSLVSNRFESRSFYDELDGDSEEDDVSPKKMGYVTIPTIADASPKKMGYVTIPTIADASPKKMGYVTIPTIADAAPVDAEKPPKQVV